MLVLVALTVGLVVWIAGWALGLKAFDTFLVTFLLVAGAAAYSAARPFVDRVLGRT